MMSLRKILFEIENEKIMNCNGRGEEKEKIEKTEREILGIKWKKVMWKEILYPQLNKI